jgi:hypothetical protein
MLGLFAVDRKTLSTWAHKAAAAGSSNARLLARLAAIDPTAIEIVTATDAVLHPAISAAVKQQQQEEGGQGEEQRQEQVSLLWFESLRVWFGSLGRLNWIMFSLSGWMRVSYLIVRRCF